MKTYSACFIMSLLFFTKANAQDIVKLNDYLITKVSINRQTEILSVNEDINNERYTIEATNDLRTKLSANYKFLGFGFGFSPPQSDRKSKFLEAKLNLFLSKWVLGADFSRIKGFYAQNIDLQNPDRDFPDLKSTSYRFSAGYLLNDRFSYKHLFQLNEWQRESSGSFIPSFTYRYNRISDFIDGDKVVQHNSDFTLSPAYYYTWCVDQNWFVTPAISPKFGMRFSKDDTNKETYFTRGFNFRLQFGFTNERVAAGATFTFESNNINYRSTRSTINDRNHAQLYFAYRFNAPKFLQRTVESIERKFGL
ncbi:DUF4421 family protein [Neotamlana laminarinivorans]|uniref:DUF4421 domain-containing protein n=1 Tax=Neotamlana laminarinivorans TaxID=2883124 RepID=A0A9X1L4Y9_9FLAO|nr:DUF4421 family protein [Tamlana laminarinivorans]MCB4799857.1 DUF4421 domain-containing protein [Tamlana laminarinivorans]